MKLNKKYEPQKKLKNQSTKTADFLFPVILPSYNRISGKNLSQYLNQSIEWNIRSQKIDKNIVPCFVRNVDSCGDFGILEEKQQLPFAAKLLRLSTHKEKVYKKSLPLFSQVFFKNHFDEIHSFLLTDKKNEKLLKLFEEKKLWKFKDELVYWDISTQSIVEDDAIDWRVEKQTQLVVKCFVETKNDVFPLVVEDPMIFFSDVGIVIHSNDKRYKKHLGKKIIIPVINKSIPILGSTDVDTIKNNGIQRLNPLVDQKTLEKVKELNLPIDENYIDDYGCFGKQVENFGGKPVFEFTDNVIETLGNIGNLVSQEEVERKIPYSKATGQRLIKKVVPMVILDFFLLHEEFTAWLEENFSEHLEYFPQNREEILIETKNPYTQKLSLLEDSEGNFERFDIKRFSKSIFSALLLDQIRKGHLNKQFSINELIDLVLLLPEQEWEDLQNQLDDEKGIKELKEKAVAKNGEELLESFFAELESLSWIEENNGNYIFLAEKLWGGKKLHSIACSDTFLQALALLGISTSQFVFHADELASQTIIDFFFFLFLLGGTECSIFPHEESDKENISFPERFPKLSENYGWETLRLFVSQGEKFDEKKLEETFGYLKHLWNLFKVLYENGAFLEVYPSKKECDGKGMFILGKWNSLKSKFETTSFKSKEYAEHIKALQVFTREEFAWYLSLVKNEKGANKYLLAGQIYMDILVHLSAIIPEFVVMVERALEGGKVQAPLIDGFFSETKDYKSSIIFDIFNGIHKKKEELQLKKHMPIEFYIQANPNMLDLVTSYEVSLKNIFNIKSISYFGTNEVHPTGYNEFNILDMNLGVKAYAVGKKESSLDEWEREMKTKQQTADYLRSVLMSLSASPLTPREKISEKQKELDDLMSDIQHLEIKIQKAKMEKKG